MNLKELSAELAKQPRGTKLTLSLYANELESGATLSFVHSGTKRDGSPHTVESGVQMRDAETEEEIRDKVVATSTAFEAMVREGGGIESVPVNEVPIKGQGSLATSRS